MVLIEINLLVSSCEGYAFWLTFSSAYHTKVPFFDVATVITEKYNFPLSDINYSEGYKEKNYMLSSA